MRLKYVENMFNTPLTHVKHVFDKRHVLNAYFAHVFNICMKHYCVKHINITHFKNSAICNGVKSPEVQVNLYDIHIYIGLDMLH